MKLLPHPYRRPMRLLAASRTVPHRLVRPMSAFVRSVRFAWSGHDRATSRAAMQAAERRSIPGFSGPIASIRLWNAITAEFSEPTPKPVPVQTPSESDRIAAGVGAGITLALSLHPLYWVGYIIGFAGVRIWRASRQRAEAGAALIRVPGAPPRRIWVRLDRSAQQAVRRVVGLGASREAAVSMLAAARWQGRPDAQAMMIAALTRSIEAEGARGEESRQPGPSAASDLGRTRSTTKVLVKWPAGKVVLPSECSRCGAWISPKTTSQHLRGFRCYARSGALRRDGWRRATSIGGYAGPFLRAWPAAYQLRAETFDDRDPDLASPANWWCSSYESTVRFISRKPAQPRNEFFVPLSLILGTPRGVVSQPSHPED